HHAVSIQRHRPQRPAGRGGRRYGRPDGCTEDREGDPCRFRLGSAHGRYHGGAVARALHGSRLGGRLSDREPAIPQGPNGARRPSSNGGTNSILPPSAGEPAMTNTALSSPSSSGSSHRRNGTSTMPRSIAAPRPSTTQITLPS